MKVVAKNHKEQTIVVNLLPGKNSSVDIIMSPTNMIKEKQNNNNAYKGISTLTDEKYLNYDATINDVQKNMDIEKYEKNRKKDNYKDNDNVYEKVENKENNSKEEQILVCLSCGYVNKVPVGKKLRFCLNCAKTLN